MKLWGIIETGNSFDFSFYLFNFKTSSINPVQLDYCKVLLKESRIRRKSIILNDFNFYFTSHNILCFTHPLSSSLVPNNRNSIFIHFTVWIKSILISEILKNTENMFLKLNLPIFFPSICPESEIFKNSHPKSQLRMC